MPNEPTSHSTAGARVLVVDDEPDVAALVAYHLARNEYRVETVGDGFEALRVVEREPPELIVLDLMLPGMSGLEVLKELRRRTETERIPIILLSARTEEADRIAGLRTGADDYLPKPFSPAELVLRVGAVLRRVRQAPPITPAAKVVRVGPFAVDTEIVRVEVAGRDVELTPTEFKLLLVLMERRGRVQSRRQLLEAVWGVTAKITTRTVDMHVQRLRSKLDAEAQWIETQRGFGYRFRKELPPAG